MTACYMQKTLVGNVVKVTHNCIRQTPGLPTSHEDFCNVTSAQITRRCCDDYDLCNKDIMFYLPFELMSTQLPMESNSPRQEQGRVGNVFTHTCIHAYIHTYIHTCIHACIHTYMHTIHACMHAYILHTHTLQHTHTRTHTHTHTHTHTRTHTHTHTHTQTQIVKVTTAKLSTSDSSLVFH